MNPKQNFLLAIATSSFFRNLKFAAAGRIFPDYNGFRGVRELELELELELILELAP